jgi:TP901 family phage tail tape measure protein
MTFREGVELTMDTDEFIVGTQQLEDALKTVGLAIERFTRVTQKLNEAGELVSGSFSGITRTGKGLDATFARLVDEEGKLTDQTYLASLAVKELGDAQKNAALKAKMLMQTQMSMYKFLAKQKKATEALAEAERKRRDLRTGKAQDKINTLVDKEDRRKEKDEVGRARKDIKKVTEEVMRELKEQEQHKRRLLKIEERVLGILRQEADEEEKKTKSARTQAQKDYLRYVKEDEQRQMNLLRLEERVLAILRQEADEEERRTLAARARSQRDVEKFIKEDQQQQRGLAGGQFATTARAQSVTGDPEKIAQAEKHLSNVVALIEKGKVSAADADGFLQQLLNDHTRIFANLDPAQRKAVEGLRSYVNTLRGVEEPTKSILLSWRSIIRIFEVQVLHVVLGKFISNMFAGTEAAAELSKRIAELQTITQDSTKATDVWSRELRELSDAFGVNELDLVEGAYEAISNQISEASNVTRFLTTAVKFSRAAVSSTADAVDLLSAAINAFGTTSVQSERFAAVLFKTIDLGRVRASEMAETLGHSTALASQLGLSMEELSASLVALTIQGVEFNTSQTLINNIMNQMLKPSEAMMDLFREWGVTSGQAAIQTFGFFGVLQRLQKEIEAGGASRLGELAQDMRAIRGLGGIIGNIDAFENALVKLGGAIDGMSDDEIIANIDKLGMEFDNAAKIVENSAGVRFGKIKTQLENVFTNDLGTAFVKSFIDFDKSIGGLASNVQTLAKLVVNTLDVLAKLAALATVFGFLGKVSTFVLTLNGYLGDGIDVITVLISVLAGSAGLYSTILLLQSAYKGLALVVGQYTAASVAAGVADQGRLAKIWALVAANRALSASIFLGAVLGAATAIYNNYVNDVKESHDKLIKDIQTADDKRIAQMEKNAQREIKIFETLQKKKTQLLAANLREMTKETQQMSAGAGMRQDFAFEGPGAEFFKPEQLDLKGLKDEFKENIESSIKSMTSSMEKLQSFDMEKMFDVDTSSLADVDDLFGKVTTKAGELLTAADLAGTDSRGDMDSAISQVDQAIDLLDELSGMKLEVFEKAKNDLEESLKSIRDLTRQADQDVFKFGLEGMAEGDQEAAIKSRIEQLRSQALTGDTESARAKFEEIDSLSRDLIDKQRDRMKKLKDLGVTGGDGLDISLLKRNNQDRINLEKNVADEAQATLAKKEELEATIQERIVDTIKQKISWEEEYQMRTQMTFANEAKILDLKEKQQAAVEKALELNNQIIEQQKQLIEQRVQLETSKSDENKNLINELGSLDSVRALDITGEGLGSDQAVFLETQLNALKAEKETIAKVLADNAATDADRKAALEQFAFSLAQFQSAAGATKGVESADVLGSRISETDTVGTVVDRLSASLEKLSQVQSDIASNETEKSNLDIQVQKRDEILEQLGLQKNLTEILGNTQKSVAETTVKALQDQLIAIKKANIELNRISSGETGIGGIGGGIAAGFATGGKFGRDNKLVRMHDGEFIMNSRSSSKFRTQLVAMNAGFAPSFANGGSVTNYNFGDMNFNIEKGDSPEQSIRSFGRAFKREIKRGNL